MTVLVRILCGACGKTAGVGLTVEHAEFSIKSSGGRIINGNVNVCVECAKATV